MRGQAGSPFPAPMEEPLDPRAVAISRRLAGAAWWVAVAVNLTVTLGFVWQLDALRSFLPGLVAIKFNTMLTIWVAILTCALLMGTPTRLGQGISRLLALLVMLVGVAVLAEYRFNWSPGMDVWFYQDVPTALSPYPGRPSQLAAVSLVSLGLALFLTDWPGLAVARQLAASVGLMVCLVALMGYLFDVGQLYGAAEDFTAISVPAAVALLMLEVASLAMRPSVGMMAAVNSSFPGGALLRRLMPAAILLPVVLGVWIVSGMRQGLFGAPFDLALMALASMVAMSLLIGWTASSLNQSEEARRQAIVERAQAKALVQVRDEYVNHLSHDLRNPLGAIMMQADFMRLQARDQPDLADGLARILANARRINGMLLDLVDSTRLEAGQAHMRLEKTELSSWLAGVLDDMLAAGDRPRVRLLPAPPMPEVAMDRAQMERVLANLVGNALKYTQGQVTVQVSREQESVTVRVQDEGPGLSDEECAHLFEKYFRGPQAGRDGGMGLGLYISRLIVRAHGGRIWARCAEGAGSVFSFSLPLAEAAGAPQVAA